MWPLSLTGPLRLRVCLLSDVEDMTSRVPLFFLTLAKPNERSCSTSSERYALAPLFYV